MRALVIGANGFAGRWLVRHLIAAGDTVVAIVGPRYAPPLDGVETVRQVDVRDYPAMRDTVVGARPEAVYYLAGVSQAAAREDVADAASIGVVGAIHALTACAALGGGIRLLYVSSAHVYGDEGGAAPISERTPVKPSSVYGAAKAAAEGALLALGPQSEVEVMIARAFNHVGPGQAAAFLLPSLAAQVREIRAGEPGIVRVGAPQIVRDYTDVRDVVAAYRLLIEAGDAGTAYNVASGRGTSVRELIEMMLIEAGVEAEVIVDGSFHREDERPAMVGDASRLAALGWTRRYELRETVSGILAASGRAQAS